MKELINYYYNFDVDKIYENKNYCSFTLLGETFYFVFFNRTKEELNDLVLVANELKQKGIKVHDFIYNREGKIITNVHDRNYVLLKLNTKENNKIDFDNVCNFSKRFVLNNKMSKLYRNNWGKLWSDKVDYFEFQISEIGKDKNIVLDSFSYYIGLAENAISYVNKINNVFKNEKNDSLTLSHRRIFYPNISLNYYNPLSFIFDLEVRDIAEYIKIGFFNNENSLLDLKTYLKINKLSSYEYHMLYVRLIYPSYYFDIYENVMNNKGNENDLLKIIKRVDDYELFLKDAYLEISKYTNLEHIDWILKKES